MSRMGPCVAAQLAPTTAFIHRLSTPVAPLFDLPVCEYEFSASAQAPSPLQLHGSSTLTLRVEAANLLDASAVSVVTFVVAREAALTKGTPDALHPVPGGGLEGENPLGVAVVQVVAASGKDCLAQKESAKRDAVQSGAMKCCCRCTIM